jgi:hypothetical protein
MFEDSDYAGVTFESLERERRREEQKERDAFETRMAAFDAGLCTLATAHEGGAFYARDIADTALELRESARTLTALMPEPIAAALTGWLASQTTARRAA